ncbi:MAG: NTP transferase domain-containing protein, partial [Gemmatimonadetes bacterium]|nr:NTP transferase domain-containing protein [Gemmatimonadota bacterium]
SVIPDLRAGEGPLAGWEALLASGRDTEYLVLSCDQPVLDAAPLAPLLAAPHAPAFLLVNEPMPARLPASLLPHVSAALDSGKRSLRDLMVTIPTAHFALFPSGAPPIPNLNTPEEWAAFRKRVAR